MKKMENSFVVSGFVGKDASIHQFSTASVARFPLAISRTEKSGEETTRTSAFINVEAWRKNENTTSFDRLVKGALLTVEGYFRPEEWQDADGVKHNRVAFVATRFYEAVEKEETPAAQEKTPGRASKAFPLSNRAAFGSLFLCLYFSLPRFVPHTLTSGNWHKFRCEGKCPVLSSARSGLRFAGKISTPTGSILVQNLAETAPTPSRCNKIYMCSRSS